MASRTGHASWRRRGANRQWIGCREHLSRELGRPQIAKLLHDKTARNLSIHAAEARATKVDPVSSANDMVQDRRLELRPGAGRHFARRCGRATIAPAERGSGDPFPEAARPLVQDSTGLCESDPFSQLIELIDRVQQFH